MLEVEKPPSTRLDSAPDTEGVGKGSDERHPAPNKTTIIDPKILTETDFICIQNKGSTFPKLNQLLKHADKFHHSTDQGRAMPPKQ